MRDQQIGLTPCLGELLLEAAQRGLQIFDLRLLIVDLLGEALAQIAIAFHPLQGDAGEVILFLVHGQLRFAHPFGDFIFVLFLFFLQQVLVGNRDCDLRLDLEKLVLHVEDNLLDHFLRVFGLVDQVVQIGPEQRGNSF